MNKTILGLFILCGLVIGTSISPDTFLSGQPWILNSSVPTINISSPKGDQFIIFSYEDTYGSNCAISGHSTFIGIPEHKTELQDLKFNSTCDISILSQKSSCPVIRPCPDCEICHEVVCKDCRQNVSQSFDPGGTYTDKETNTTITCNQAKACQTCETIPTINQTLGYSEIWKWNSIAIYAPPLPIIKQEPNNTRITMIRARGEGRRGEGRFPVNEANLNDRK